ncbi:MAG: GNAT family N-acetyltransferase [Nanoarchaeota archaeon]
MDTIIIKKANLTDWKQYKEIRLDALRTNPESFGSSYEEEVKIPISKWKENFKNKNRVRLIALENKKAIGILVVVFETAINLAHIANIYSVYVKPEYRGKGVSTKLMNHALEIIKSKKIINKVKLSVVTKQLSAIYLYEKFGFRKVGELRKELKVKGNYYDEYIMELIL